MKQRSIFMRVLFCKINCPFICFCKPSAANIYKQGQLKLENIPPQSHAPSTVAADDDDTRPTPTTTPTPTPTVEEVIFKEDNSDDGKQHIQRVLISCLKKQPPPPPSKVNGLQRKKKVQWLDNLGKPLVQIKEFESSETGSTDIEEDNRGCVCIIL